LVRFLVNTLASDLMAETSRQLQRLRIADLASLRAAQDPVCRYSDETAAAVAELKAFLNERLYHHPRLAGLAKQAHETIGVLFESLLAHLDLLPPRFRAMLEHERREIVVADYIAGMTDRFAENLRRSFL